MIEEINDEIGIDSCFDVMVQLRPHLNRESFHEQVMVMQPEGYRIVRMVKNERVVACAGFRIFSNLVHGKQMYIDDLVTDESSRSQNFGTQLLDWLVAKAKEEGCRFVNLDSGTQRHAAHRFYFRNFFSIFSFRFSKQLELQIAKED